MLFWFLKKTYQKWKKHYSSGFCRIYQKIRGLIEHQSLFVRFLWNGLHEMNCYINKCRWDVQDLGKSASQSLLVER